VQPCRRTTRGLQSLAGLPAFLVYFCTAIIAVVAYLFVYTRVTPHNEFQLIRDNDPAAAIALGLSLLGFVLPVVSAIAHSANVVDCLIWSAIALIVQIVVYFIIKIPFRTCRRGSQPANSRPRSGSGSPRSPQARSTLPQ
jgi:putative membrane protein